MMRNGFIDEYGNVLDTQTRQIIFYADAYTVLDEEEHEDMDGILDLLDAAQLSEDDDDSWETATPTSWFEKYRETFRENGFRLPSRPPCTKKCECGSEAVGSTKHSDWCPKYESI